MYGEADFLKEAYADSNNKLNSVNKTQQLIISNPDKFTQESRDRFNSLFKPETFDKFGDDIIGGALHVDEVINSLEEKPVALKPEYWFENDYIKTAKARVNNKKYSKDGSGYDKDVIDREELNKQVHLAYNKMTPGQQLNLLGYANGDEAKAYELIEQNLLSNVEKLSNSTTVVTNDKKSNDISLGGKTVDAGKFAWSGSVDPKGNFVQRIGVKSAADESTVFIPIKGKDTQAKFIGYKLDESKGKWEAIFKTLTPIEGEKIDGTNKYKIDYKEDEVTYTLDSNDDFMDINNKSQLISGVDWKSLNALSEELALREGVNLKEARKSGKPNTGTKENGAPMPKPKK